jgi:hypothetical protein
MTIRTFSLLIVLACLIVGTTTATRAEAAAPTSELLGSASPVELEPMSPPWAGDDEDDDETSDIGDDEDDDEGDEVCECPCPQDCGGPEGTPCDEGQFCQREQGDCSEVAEGVCTDISGVCQPIVMEVCGCDGRTYSNACFAAAAGVTVDRPGPCVEAVACGGTAGDTCEEGQYCRRLPGHCSEEDPGVCRDVPRVCPTNLAPVCGCDGTTYDNPCSAASAGVNIAAAGACDGAGQACGGEAGECEEGQFCQRELGECAEDAAGTCASTPAACPSFLAPVCGCDGVTYDNACVAHGAGVNVASDGACASGQACGGAAGDCGEGEYCSRPRGECTEDAEGVCATVPAACPTTFAPVCGCDGMTYPNACFAAGSGVTVDQQGPCMNAIRSKGSRGRVR